MHYISSRRSQEDLLVVIALQNLVSDNKYILSTAVIQLNHLRKSMG